MYQCVECGAPALYACGACGSAFYCGVACQRTHWRVHGAAAPLGSELAARSRPRIVAYTTAVDASARSGAESEQSFAAQVAATLQDARGWRRYGCHFVALDGARPGASPAVAPPGTALRVRVVLVSAAVAARACGQPGFSCWLAGSSAGRGVIAINYANWMGLSASRLPLARYRHYVINHEMGHALGLGHGTCAPTRCQRFWGAGRACPASVMQQMTRGPAHVAPCVESEWPLDPGAGGELR